MTYKLDFRSVLNRRISRLGFFAFGNRTGADFGADGGEAIARRTTSGNDLSALAGYVIIDRKAKQIVCCSTAAPVVVAEDDPTISVFHSLKTISATQQDRNELI